MKNSLAIRQILENFGPQKAERQMALISDEFGDNQLAVIVSELHPAEILPILKEGDFTKPSVATEFVSEEQFVGAIERFGSSWDSVHSMKIEEMLFCKGRLEDFITSVVLTTADLNRRKKLIGVMVTNPLLRSVLSILPLYEKDNHLFLSEALSFSGLDPKTAKIGTWEEVFAEMHHFYPKRFQHLCKEIVELYESDINADKKPVFDFLKSVLDDLREAASQHTTTKEEKTSSKVFVDI